MKNQKDNLICVFDCETVPDTKALRECFGYEGSDEEVANLAFSEQKNRTGSEFLPVNFHKIVCISAVMADEFGKFIRVSSLEGDNEKEKLAKFIGFINERSPRLISFNGRGFDLPMIMVRAMRYNLTCGAYFDTKDKWKNYRSRYDGVFHLDLLDHISEFRAVSGLNLNSLCKTLNLPGKYDVHGDDVFRLYFEGKFDKIEEYCESDVLNTYWLFLKYELLRGGVNLDDYINNLACMRDFIANKRSDMSYNGVFCEYVDAEFKNMGVKLPDL